MKYKDKIGHIYVLKDTITNRCKVGRSQAPFYRINAHLRNTGSHAQDCLIYISELVQDHCKLEKRIHHKLSPWRLRGEWYVCDYTKIVNLVNEEILNVEADERGGNQEVLPNLCWSGEGR